MLYSEEESDKDDETASGSSVIKKIKNSKEDNTEMKKEVSP